ncbi:MAG TPA: ketopantoate reductase family protein [Anaerolineae bacterium]|nr:ketopantoate reductase family protein [Anaerolineae bacterium]
MMETAPEITIIGAGGIGCALGHALLSGGMDVIIVEVDEAKLAWGWENGIGLDHEPAQRAKFLHFDHWQPRPDDLVLLCTKCYDNRTVLARVPPNLKLIPIQNGFDEQLMNRVEIEGIASFVTECMSGRTHTWITRPGDLHIGFSMAEHQGKLSDKVENLIGVLETHGKFSVRRVPEVLPYKNTKLLYNAAISPIAAVAGLDNGELLTIPKARKLFFGLIAENYRILKSTGSPMARIGPFHPDSVAVLLRLPLVARMLAIPFSRTLKGTYCSMAGDLPNGPTELENYNGHLLRLAGDHGFPLNREVYAVTRYVEENGLQPGMSWLDELLAKVDAS